MSNSRRQMREVALQVLFVWDAQETDDAALAEDAARGVGAEGAVSRRGIEMARAAWNQRTISDAWMERLAPQWPPHRQPGVDRAILRMSLWELTDNKTPPKVVLDEAIELARAFSTENSPAFVNGVLDAALREHTALMAGTATLPNEAVIPPAEAAASTSESAAAVSIPNDSDSSDSPHPPVPLNAPPADAVSADHSSKDSAP